MRDYIPAMDHSILSPSGRCSKRARAAALKREGERLFPPGFWDPPAKSPAQFRDEQVAALERQAARLRDLAARGMQVRAFTKQAERIDQQIADIKRQMSQ